MRQDMNSSPDAVKLDELDFVVSTQLTATFLGAELRRRLDAAGFGDLRDSHGFLMQHLLGGAISITDLAHRLGISQQAVSKSSSELQASGYLLRQPVSTDRRTRVLVLTERGLAMVQHSRQIRAELAAELAAELGVDLLGEATSTLHQVLAHLGAEPQIAGRSVRPAP